MHKILVFDLDGTLAQIGKGMLPADADKLIELEQMGYKIAICSGKSGFYLCGFARQLGLKEPILVGENGATFQFGIDLPPKRYEVYPYGEKAKVQLEAMKILLKQECKGKVWFQPNEVALTPFPQDEETFDIIQRLINERIDWLHELLIYRHIDCFDLIPKSINKYNGVRYLTKLMGGVRQDVIAVGDGVNDIPMFEAADIAIGICKKDQSEELRKTITESTDYVFETIGEVLDFIRNEMSGKQIKLLD